MPNYTSDQNSLSGINASSDGDWWSQFANVRQTIGSDFKLEVRGQTFTTVMLGDFSFQAAFQLEITIGVKTDVVVGGIVNLAGPFLVDIIGGAKLELNLCPFRFECIRINKDDFAGKHWHRSNAKGITHTMLQAYAREKKQLKAFSKKDYELLKKSLTSLETKAATVKTKYENIVNNIGAVETTAGEIDENFTELALTGATMQKICDNTGKMTAKITTIESVQVNFKGSTVNIVQAMKSLGTSTFAVNPLTTQKITALEVELAKIDPELTLRETERGVLDTAIKAADQAITKVKAP